MPKREKLKKNSQKSYGNETRIGKRLRKTSDTTRNEPPNRHTPHQKSNISNRTKLYFIFGFLFLLISIGWHLNQTIQLTFFTPKVTPVEKKHAIPTQISIPKVGTNLPIAETALNNGAWQIANNAVSHLTISARPGEKGPIILYDHNTDDKFGPIRWLTKGEKINIKTKDNKIHTYTITQTMTVPPEKIEIFTQQKGESLILYTCDGFADLQRFVVIAKPE